MTFLSKIKEFFFGPSEAVPAFNTIETPAEPVKAPTLEVVEKEVKPKKKKAAKAKTEATEAEAAPKKTRKKNPELRVEK